METPKEKNPKKPSDRPLLPSSFTFSLRTGEDQKKDVSLRLDALQERLTTLDRKSALRGEGDREVPVIRAILSLTKDPEQLEILAKTLDRVAKILPQIEELEQKKSVMDILTKNPQWFAAQYGDFSQDIEAFLESTSIETGEING